MDFIILIILMFVVAFLTEATSKVNGKNLKVFVVSAWKYTFPYFSEDFKGVGRLFPILIHLLLTTGLVSFVNRRMVVGVFEISFSYIVPELIIVTTSLVIVISVLRVFIAISFYGFNYYRGSKFIIMLAFPVIYLIYVSRNTYPFLPATNGAILGLQIVSLIVIYRELIFMIIRPNKPDDNKNVDVGLRLIALGSWFTTIALNFIAMIYHIQLYIVDLFKVKQSIMDIVYFYFMTFLTIGYGDITPINDIGKLLSITISFTGFLFIAVFISLSRNSVKKF